MVTSVKRINRNFGQIVKTITSTLTTIGDYGVGDMESVSFKISPHN